MLALSDAAIRISTLKEIFFHALRAALDPIKPDQPLILEIQRQGQLSYMVLDSE